MPVAPLRSEAARTHRAVACRALRSHVERAAVGRNARRPRGSVRLRRRRFWGTRRSMWSRNVPGFLSPRERVILLTVARSEGFEPGRLDTGYEKKNVLEHLACERLIKRAVKELGDPVLFDAWLLRYPVGSEIPAHVDPPIDGLSHVRLNALVLAGQGGLLYLDGAEAPLDEGEALLFRPDVVRHQVTRVERNPRLVFSVGANVPEDQARALFAH